LKVAKHSVISTNLLPTNGVVGGENIQRWTEDWWSWAIPNHYGGPDLGGGVSANGKMFFLPGAFADQAEPVVRDITVPGLCPQIGLIRQFIGQLPILTTI
jgi:hypothetical protein